MRDFSARRSVLLSAAMSHRAGFTLLEICLALFIGLMLITIAVPSIAAVLAEQRMKASFEEFDRFVRLAREKSITERRGYAMVWDGKGLALRPLESRDTDDREVGPDRFDFEEGETFTLDRPSALIKKPPGEWVFWRSGLCEQAVVSFAGEAGSWSVRYDPLTVRATFLDSEVK